MEANFYGNSGQCKRPWNGLDRLCARPGCPAAPATLLQRSQFFHGQLLPIKVVQIIENRTCLPVLACLPTSVDIRGKRHDARFSHGQTDAKRLRRKFSHQPPNRCSSCICPCWKPVGVRRAVRLICHGGSRTGRLENGTSLRAKACEGHGAKASI